MTVHFESGFVLETDGSNLHPAIAAGQVSEVDRTDFGDVANSFDVPQMDITTLADHTQPVPLNGRKMGAARDEGHIGTANREPCPKITADGSCSENRNTHDRTSKK
jgi:hypothetical protein